MQSELTASGHAGFTLKEKRVLFLAVREFGTAPFQLRDLEPWTDAEGIPGAELYRIVYRLWSRGILYAVSAGWEEMRYVLPEERLPYGVGQLVPELAGLPGIPYVEDDGQPGTAKINRPESRVFSLLVYAERNGLTLTGEGNLSQRDRKKLESGMASIRPVLDLALELGLLTRQGKQLKPDKAVLPGWLDLSAAAMRDTLYRLWRKKAAPEDSDARLAAAAAENLPQGVWMPAETLLETLTKYGMLKKPAAMVYGLFVDGWMIPLRESGFAETAVLTDGKLAFRRTAIGDEAAGGNAALWYVQPDFEVILTGNVSYSVRWELEELALPLDTEPVEIYRLTKNGFLRAWNNGKNAETCLQFLEQYAMAPIPDGIRTAFADWETEAFKGHPVNFCPESTDFALSLLRERTESLILEAGPGFNRTLAEPPAPESLWTECLKVPPGWLKQAGRYHPSTQRELAQKAIEWKTALKLVNGSTERFVIPKRLTEEGVSWRLQAIDTGNPVWLVPGDWEEMQIVHPATLTD